MYLFGILFLVSLNSALAETTPGSADKTVLERGTIYSPIGKRDPFKPLSLSLSGRDTAGYGGLEKFGLEQFQLRAILRGMGKAKAMFEDPEGKTYILSEGDKIGREHSTISRIVNSEVILTQRTFNYLGAESLLEKVLSLAKDADIDASPPQRGARPEAAKDAAAALAAAAGVTGAANLGGGGVGGNVPMGGVPGGPPPVGVNPGGGPPGGPVDNGPITNK